MIHVFDAADVIGVGRDRLYRHCKAGKVPGAVFVGGRWFVDSKTLPNLRGQYENSPARVGFPKGKKRVSGRGKAVAE